jgi:hypothetical protein
MLFIGFAVSLLLILSGCSINIKDLYATRHMNALPSSMSENIKSIPPLLVTPILKNPRILTEKEILALVPGSTGYWLKYERHKKVKFISANYFSPDGRLDILEDLRSRYMVMLDKKSFHRDVARWEVKGGVLIFGFNISNKKIHYSPWILVRSDNLPNDQYYIFEFRNRKPNYGGIIAFKPYDLERDIRLGSTCMLAKNPPNIQCCEGTSDFSNWLQSSACKAFARGWDQQSADIGGQISEGLKQILSGQFPVTPNILKKAICGYYGGNC